MMLKKLKSINLIKEMQSCDKFNISRILNLSLKLTVEKLLNQFNIIIKDLIFNMQRFILKYKIKRSKINIKDQEVKIMQVSMIIFTAILSSKVMIRAYKNNNLSKSLMINF